MNKIIKYFKYKFLAGHIHIKILNMVIYGRTAMHWGVTIHTDRYGYICFRLPLPCFGKWWPLYFYFSPDATPNKSTLFFGKKEDLDDWTTARIRYKYLGHNYDIKANLKTLNIIRYFYPGEINNFLDIMHRCKAEITALSVVARVDYNDLLISDIKKYLKTYAHKEDPNDGYQ